ncbi:MAG: addiction module antidote protein [Gemmatimonadaceae bacterium]|nr:addiction module antidote protein [Gemmatimonadaceae bacterium]
MKTPRAPLETFPYDVADRLTSARAMQGYLDASLIEFPDDTESFSRALGDVARAFGMTAIARKTGLGRESLYKSLTRRAPSFATVMKVLAAVGVQFRVVER